MTIHKRPHDDIMRKMGFDEQVNRRQHDKCPFCNKRVALENLRDDSSRKEFQISGLCQKCQDEMFGK